MPLTNKQRASIIRVSKAQGYTGDYADLFNQAEKEGIFKDVAVEQENTQEVKTPGFSQDYNLDLDSLLIDKTPHRFNNVDTFINSAHGVDPNPKAIIQFLSDPFYTPEPEPQQQVQNPQQKEEGGFKKKMHQGGPGTGLPVHPEVHIPGTFIHERDPDRLITTTKIENSVMDQQNFLKNNKFYNKKIDGDFGEGTTKAMLLYSNKNLSHLPVYNAANKHSGIRCTSGGCSRQSTDFMMKLYPNMGRVDAGASHSWYRRNYMLDHGGEDIWSTNAIGTFNTKGELTTNKDMPTMPPMETWKNFKVGDVVSLTSLGDISNFGNIDEKEYGQDLTPREQGYEEGQNRGTGHTGFIVGRDPETGMPMIMHGHGGKMWVQRMDRINFGREDREGFSQPSYIIDAVTRPSYNVDNPDAVPNMSILDAYVEKSTNFTFTSLSMNNDYTATRSEREQETDQFFLDWANGAVKFEGSWYPQGFHRADKEYYEDLNSYNKREENRPITEIEAIQTDISNGRTNGTSGNTPVGQIMDATGYSRQHVTEKLGLLYGLHQQETGGSSGFAGGEHEGMIKNYLKNNYSPTTTAFLKSIKEGDVPFMGDKWKYNLQDAKSTPSSGILRIKLEDQMYEMGEDGELTDQLTELGQWYKTLGITNSSQLTSGDAGEVGLLTGKVGERGKYNSYSAGLLQLLYYDQRVRKMDEFDSENETINGVPINYAIVAMHKNPHLKTKLYSGDISALNYMEQGDRDYSNNVIQHSQNVLYSTKDLRTTDYAKTIGYTDGEGIFHPKFNANNPEYKKVSHYPIPQYTKELEYWQGKGKTLKGQVSTQTKYSGHQQAINTFFKEGQSDKVLKNLNKIDEPDTQTRYLIKKLEYGKRISDAFPGFSDEKVLELIDAQFLGETIPPEDIDVSTLTLDFNYDKPKVPIGVYPTQGD